MPYTFEQAKSALYKLSRDTNLRECSGIPDLAESALGFLIEMEAKLTNEWRIASEPPKADCDYRSKYTDEQIKKAKAHFKYGIDCDIFSEPVLTYAKIALDALDALDIINRQESEIERLREELTVSQTGYVSMEGHAWQLERKLATAKSEAIKEFAERLKSTFPPREDKRCTLDDCYTLDIIDNLVKEMVGESDAQPR